MKEHDDLSKPDYENKSDLVETLIEFAEQEFEDESIEVRKRGDKNLAGCVITRKKKEGGYTRIDWEVEIWAGHQFGMEAGEGYRDIGESDLPEESFYGPNEVEVEVFWGDGRRVKVDTQLDDDRVEGIGIDDGTFYVEEHHEMEKTRTVEVDL